MWPIGSLSHSINTFSSQLDKSQWAKHLLGVGDTGHDIVSLSNGGKMVNNHAFNQVIAGMPRPVQKVLASVVNFIDAFPGSRSMSATVKFGLAKIIFVLGAWDAFKMGKEAFQYTQGSTASKVKASLVDGSQSLLKHGMIFTTSMIAAVLTPALLGLSPVGTLGILASLATSIFAGHQTQKYLDQLQQQSPVFKHRHPSLAQPKQPQWYDSFNPFLNPAKSGSAPTPFN